MERISGYPTALPPLMAALAFWYCLAISGATLVAIAGEVGKPRVADYLSADPHRREQAATALLKMGTVAIPALLDAYVEAKLPARQLIADILPRFGPDSFDTLYEAGERDFGNPMMGEDNVMWRAAIEAAIAIGPEVFPRAFHILENESPYQAQWLFAARVLEGSKGVPLDLIERLLTHKESKVRTEGASLLGRDGSDAAVRRLIVIAETGGVLERLAAVTALSQTRSPLGIPTFLRAMSDSANVTREYAAVGLGKHYEPRFRVPLARMARNDRAASRAVACTILTRSGGTSGVNISSRYRPMGVGPLQVIRMENVAYLKIAFSGVLAVILGVLTRYTDKRGPLGYLGLALLGLAWGGWMSNMWWAVETTFVFVIVPGMMVVGAYVESPRPFWPGIKSRWSKLAGLIYAGYFVGQTWLWGGSIKWLRLWLPASVAW